MASGAIRDLTKGLGAHHSFLRVLVLSSGDYLLGGAALRGWRLDLIAESVLSETIESWYNRFGYCDAKETIGQGGLEDDHTCFARII
ncbi:MAG: hypothetical protein R2932_37670 [Caldilineaceae bacterium]